MYDLLIKNGLVYDGKGGEAFLADIAVKGEKISKIGEIDEKAKKVIDANGKIVTPGFVDIHTHFDGQVTWDPYLRSSTYPRIIDWKKFRRISDDVDAYLDWLK